MYEQAIEDIQEHKVIVILRGVEKAKLIPLCEAMYAGGIRLVECTYDARGAISDEEIAGNIEMLAKHFAGRMQIGAGTVLREAQVALTAAAGGTFIISPDTNEQIIRATKAAGLVSIPGAITPPEIALAHRVGADFVKVFPVDLYGPKYIKTLAAPLSHVKMLAVNGITAENMSDYLAAGACGVGVGSGIADKKLIAAGDFEGITALAKHYTEKL